MDDRCGVCPYCGGWLVADGDTISCDTCEAEWYDGKQIKEGFSDETD